MKKSRESPALRSIEERNKLVEQWKYLPSYVVHKKMKYNPIILNIGKEDAVQIGFVALIRAADLWDDKAGVAFNTYAMTSIMNWIVREGLNSGLISVPTYLLKEAHQNHHFKKYVNIVKTAKYSTNEEHVDYRYSKDIITRDNVEFVKVVLGKLNERRRTILYKYFFQGKSFRRIGEEVGLTKQRVEVIICRSIELLREKLGADYELKGSDFGCGDSIGGGCQSSEGESEHSNSDDSDHVCEAIEDCG